MNSTEDIISLAKSCGFDLAGIAKAEIPEQDRLNIKSWVEKKLFGKMEWYPRNQKLRLELDGIGFKPESVIALGLLYLDENYDSVFGKFRFKFSKYAVGTDYHTVLRQKAKPMIDSLREKFPGYHFRQGVDSFPVPEKVMAREAGIGWIGKNTNLINENIGSFFFLSVILTDLRMPHD
ncbi:MAG: DUF1730 domain-containing protein, partial [Leptospira sp.]|nr:DUF1730 domain-containing protein [Leptospira sp.]